MDTADIAEQLQKPLGPEFVSFKTGHAYLEGHKAVALANEIFGFDGWSSEIKKLEVDYSEEVNRKFCVSANCIMRVTTKSGSFREDVGVGSSINMPSRFQAMEKARKEATTDALKRALRQFGESLGNCLYNKEYIDVVKRTKPEKLTFDQDDMRRPRKKLKREITEPAIASNRIPAPVASAGRSATTNPRPVNAYIPPVRMQSTPVERTESPRHPPHQPPHQPQLPSSDDEAPPDFASDVVFEGEESDNEAGFTSGAGYNDDNSVSMQGTRHQPYDVSKSHIQNTRIPQDRSEKVFR